MQWSGGVSSTNTSLSVCRSCQFTNYGMLPAGEIHGLRSSQIVCSTGQPTLVISLGFTKGGKRQGAAESTVVGYDMVVQIVQHWKSLASPATPLAKNPAHWRALFDEALEALQLQSYAWLPPIQPPLRWCDLVVLDKILLQGRPVSHPSLSPFLRVFDQQSTRLTFSTLEPPVPGRAGGRGKRLVKGSRRGSSKRSKRSKKSLGVPSSLFL